MKKFIKKIQNKPEHVRKQILYVATIAIGGLIVIFWIFTLQYRFSSIDAAKVQEELKPFSIIKDNIASTYNDVSSKIKAQ